MLDGMRAIAVFLVILYHAGFPLPGGLGVLTFFVISGFLITWLLLKEYDSHGSISLPGFYARRSLRIFPAFYTYCAIVLVLLALRHRPILWPHTAAALLYYCNYYQAILGDPNDAFSHAWSLAVEEQFYLLWPVSFLLWKNRLPRLRIVLVTAILTFWVYRAVLQFVLHVDQGYLYEAFDARADHLLVGCLLAVVLWTSRFENRWQALTGVWQLGLTVCALTASAVLEARFGSLYRDSIGFMFNPLLAAFLIVQLISCRDRMVVSWLQCAPVRYLGRISYSLYLYQQLILPVAGKILAHFEPGVRASLSIMAVVAAASASYYLVEEPFLRLKRHFSPA